MRRLTTGRLERLGAPVAGEATPGTIPAAHPVSEVLLARISELLVRWFTRYSRRYIRKHFHSVRVSVSAPLPSTDLPLVVYSNHASWWDPLVCLVLKAEFFPGRKVFAPIDANALRRYRMLGRMGFFGVEQGSSRGAATFLRTGKAVLRNPEHLLAVTPQSRFADARERPLRFQPGLGHLALHVDQAAFAPLAIEYVFWEERLPEVLARFGQVVEVRPGGIRPSTARDWTSLFEQRLAEAQDALAAESQRRRPEEFRVLLRGGAGQGGVYDLWRSARAAIRGETFNREHGRK